MIRLHPIPECSHVCPYCHVQLDVTGWLIPGMRNLGDLRCPSCQREFYGDLPAAHGLYYPMLLEKSNGKVYDKAGVRWFAIRLENSYKNRIKQPVDLKVENFRGIKKPVLLNCLDLVYGHALLKLLGAEYYLNNRREIDLIILIPKFLRWLVPDGVAEIWTLDIALDDGAIWNDWLAEKIRARIEPFPTCYLGLSFSHPHPQDFHIEKFTRIPAFPVEEWGSKIRNPKITFIYREDRIWKPKSLRYKIRALTHSPAKRQILAINELFQHLKSRFPDVELSVIGFGRSGKLNADIHDLRENTLTTQVEKDWCERYSQSICVLGVHGSNMLLPSALAGSVLELVPDNRWPHLIQDILVQGTDVRDVLFRYQFIPLSCSPNLAAELCERILLSYPAVRLNFMHPWVDHEYVAPQPGIISKIYLEIQEKMGKLKP